MFKFESKARSSERAAIAELRSLVAAVHRSQAVIEFDLNGIVREANDNFLSVLGYQLGDIQGRHHSMFVDPNEAASTGYADFWRRLNAGEYLVSKFVRYGNGGRRVVIEASYNPILDAEGRPYKVVKFATDVTAVEEERERRVTADRLAAGIQSAVVEGTRKGLSAMAAGDLSYRISEPFPDDYAALRDDFNAAMTALDAAVGIISGNAGAIMSRSRDISAATQDLSSRTDQQASALEETSAALEQFSATVRKTAANTTSTDAVVNGTSSRAETGGRVVQSAINAMSEIERSSDEIGDIVGVIDEIAFQTNLLALNAGVEAARAGDSGRGFAVVASEVRALAKRSADSAKTIKALISTSSAQVKTGVALVRQTGDAFSEITQGLREVTALMSDIRSSAQEQAADLSKVDTAVHAMDQVTRRNAAMVEESLAASQALSGDAAQMIELIRRFQVTAETVMPSSSPAAVTRGEDHIPTHEAVRPRLVAVAGRATTADWEEF
ncbi:methyl-accepting chemotaxis protein [Brevundimonas vesicularis]|uniref:Methyl-accepting chemotaxis protein n=1 Tax=Brevundimonas vesicularis TaxID=41276 RepID=A0A7W9FTZ0_BREVE|nr:methyl-accepting chemotaxis protein [Brevundimonas vesicularis]MBB5771530.1 methyl-accepting chemotaxis protein [Brevundimonas vesicularis]